jgi:putative endonuclease
MSAVSRSATTTGDRRGTVGRLGERAAARHLEESGFQVLERNYRCREGEIDLIAASRETLVFCEVKTLVARGLPRRGPAHLLESVTPSKRAQVRRLARGWLAEHRHGTLLARRPNVRFDAIGVLLAPDGSLLALEHVPSAW